MDTRRQTFLSSLEERQKQCRLFIDNIGDILHKNMSNMAIYMVSVIGAIDRRALNVTAGVLCQPRSSHQGAEVAARQKPGTCVPSSSIHDIYIVSDLALTYPIQHLREDPAVRNLDLSSYLLVPSL